MGRNAISFGEMKGDNRNLLSEKEHIDLPLSGIFKGIDVMFCWNSRRIAEQLLS